MQRTNLLSASVAAALLALGSPAAADHIPGHQDTDPVFPVPIPGQDESWSRHLDPDLARRIDDWGPWVSPGRYTVEVEARGTRASTVVDVRGDPEMPMITQAMYESREQFMLESLALSDASTITGSVRAPMDAGELVRGTRTAA